MEKIQFQYGGWRLRSNISASERNKKAPRDRRFFTVIRHFVASAAASCRSFQPGGLEPVEIYSRSVLRAVECCRVRARAHRAVCQRGDFLAVDGIDGKLHVGRTLDGISNDREGFGRICSNRNIFFPVVYRLKRFRLITEVHISVGENVLELRGITVRSGGFLCSGEKADQE